MRQHRPLLCLQRACLFCTAPFTTTNKKKLFCSDTCRAKFGRDHNTCFYCGEIATQKEHITPTAVDPLNNRETVPACQECNHHLGGENLTFDQRINKLGEFFQKQLKGPFWSQNELNELGYNLRGYVQAQLERRDRYERRLFHLTTRYQQWLTGWRPSQNSSTKSAT